MIANAALLAGLAGLAGFAVDVVVRASRDRSQQPPGGTPVSSLCDRRRSAVRLVRVDDDRVAG